MPQVGYQRHGPYPVLPRRLRVQTRQALHFTNSTKNHGLSIAGVIYDPWHYVPVLARKPGALRNGAPFKDWPLPASLERVRRKLRGFDDGDRQMVKILSAVLSDGLAAVEAACAAALADGVHSADVVLNILSRRHEPGPVPTILTPQALQLRHLPIADCARYDQLRLAG